MTPFLSQTITIHRRKIAYLLKLLLLAPLAFSISLYADNHYLFPSDIIDKAEQSQFELERSNRYATQREWTYPEESTTNTRNKIPFGKAPAYYPNSDHYITIDGQPVSHQAEPDYGLSRYPQSDHYKYDDFNVNPTSPTYPPADNNSRSLPTSTRRDLQYDAARMRQYPDGISDKYYGRKNFQSVMPADSMVYPQTKYTQENNADSFENRNNYQAYPHLLYPGDIEADKQFMNPKYQAMPYQYPPRKQPKQSGAVGQIRYVPVPVYGVPGTLPGTIPGVVTPGNMVPGYSHLSPNYNNGFNNFFGSQYMPVNPFNNFQPLGNPFGSFYNNNGNNSFNNMPFTNPNFMVPGLSMPDMFSTAK